jgi:hypothetical protein
MTLTTCGCGRTYASAEWDALPLRETESFPHRLCINCGAAIDDENAVAARGFAVTLQIWNLCTAAKLGLLVQR